MKKILLLSVLISFFGWSQTPLERLENSPSHGGVHLGNHKLHDTERVFVVMSMIILSIFIVENLLLLVASPTEFLTVETTCV